MTNWPTKKLGEVATIVGGSTPPTSNADNFMGNIPWFTPTELGFGEINYLSKSHRMISDGAATFTTVSGTNSVLLSSRAGIGKVGILENPAAYNQGIKAIDPDDNRLNCKFLAYWLIANKNLLEERASGTTFLELSRNSLMNLEIPLPPIEKQKRIVAKLEKLLGKVKEAKRLRAKAQAATASLLPATLHKIFSEGSDRGWQVKPFSEVVKIEAQKNTKVLPYVGMEDIESGTGRFTGSKSAKRVKSNTSWFNTKHILYGKLRPYLNKFLMPDFEGHCSTELLPLLPDPRYLSRGWLATWLRQNNIVEKINATGAGSRMPRANMKLVAKFLIPLPSLAEQRKIVAHLDQLSEKIHQLQEYQKQTAADLDALEKSILHQAFSGGL